MYSTSANITGEKFDKEWAMKQADIVIENEKGLFEGEASKIYKINNFKIKKIR